MEQGAFAPSHEVTDSRHTKQIYFKPVTSSMESHIILVYV